MSPKRPISTQHTTAKGASAKAPDLVRDAKRETGPEHDDADATTAVGHGERAVPDLAHHSESTTSAASAAVTRAAGRVLGTTDAPKDAFDPSSKLDERAGRAQSERDGLRERARHGLQDDAAGGDGTTGIAEQGTAAIKEAPSSSGLATIGSGNFTADGEVRATGTTDIANDPDFENNPIVRLAKGINETSAGRTKREADAAGDDAPAPNTAGGEKAPAGTASTDTPGGVKFTHADGSTTVLNRDGTEVTKDGTTTTIKRPDGSTTTQSTDTDGNTTVVDTDKDGKTTTTPVGSVDDEHQHRLDPEQAHLLGLDRFEDELRGPGLAGGGNTDPVDDDGFGTGAFVGAPSVVAAAGSTLLTGGDTRGSEIGSGGAGNRPVDPGGNAGAIDLGPDADPGFGGGGREDDPLDNGQGPSLGLDAGREAASSTNTDDAASDDDIDTGEPTTEAPFRLIDPAPLHHTVLDQVVSFDADGDDDATPDDPND